MLINEIEANALVTVRLINGSNTFDIHTETVHLNDNEKLLLEQKLGKDFVVTKLIPELINFDTSSCKKVVISTKNNTPYIWAKDIVFKVIQLKDKKYHIILCSENASNKNLRRSYRQLLKNVNGSIYSKDGTFCDFATIKDISLNGVGLVVSKYINVSVDDEFKLFFSDSDYPENFELELSVVRIKTINEDKVLLGCKYMENQDYSLSRYIATKQRHGLRIKPKK